MARKYIEKYHYKSPPIDIYYILQREGYEILEVDTFSDGLDAMLVEDGGQKYAAVNKNQPEVRRRFSLAHEMGHKVLNHNLTYYREIPSIDNPPERSYFSHKSAQRDLENEANEYAGELLVPLKLLKSEFYMDNDIARLAKRFNVSREVLTIRYQNHIRSLI